MSWMDILANPHTPELALSSKNDYIANSKKPAFLLVGEALVDLISTESAGSLEDTRVFHKYAGGEVANLAMNLARYSGSPGSTEGDHLPGHSDQTIPGRQC
jgi:hypothetical protein